MVTVWLLYGYCMVTVWLLGKGGASGEPTVPGITSKMLMHHIWFLIDLLLVDCIH